MLDGKLTICLLTFVHTHTCHITQGNCLEWAINSVSAHMYYLFLFVAVTALQFLM